MLEVHIGAAILLVEQKLTSGLPADAQRLEMHRHLAPAETPNPFAKHLESCGRRARSLASSDTKRAHKLLAG